MLGLTCAALLISCAPGTTQDAELALDGSALGTTWRVRAIPEGEPLSADERQALRRELQRVVESQLELVDASMSTYRPDSELERFNALPAGEPVPLSGELAHVLAAAFEIWRSTGGAFDPTVGPLVDRWGFGAAPPPSDDLIPTEAELEALRSSVGMDKLTLLANATPPSLDKHVGGLRLDLSAIAKGYAVDRVALALEELGIRRYLVEVGGEIRVAGYNAAGRAWRVAVERPLPGPSGAAPYDRIIELEGAALATSGDYRNFYEVDGVRYSHTIDPRTASPVTHALASVSVVADDCMTADALATALMVLGPEEGFRLAEEKSVAALFLVYDPENGYDSIATSRFRTLDPLNTGGRS